MVCKHHFNTYSNCPKNFLKIYLILDDNLLIGTREGHLLMYHVPQIIDLDHKLELLRHSKNFNKKRITQIDVVPEYHLLILLTGIHISTLENKSKIKLVVSF